jgi:hypothetical protein
LIIRRICCQPRFERGTAANVFHDEGMIDFVECEEVWNADRRNLGVDRRFAQELETFGLVQL